MNILELQRELEPLDRVQRVERICSLYGVKIAKLERECGFSNGYIRSLKNGNLPIDRIYKIAEYFDISPELIIHASADPSFISKKERSILTCVRELNDAGVEKVIEYIDMLMRLPEYQKGQKSLGSNVG